MATPLPLLARQAEAEERLRFQFLSCGLKVAIQVCASYEPCLQSPFGILNYTCGCMRIVHNSLFVIPDVGGGNTEDIKEDSKDNSNFALSHVPLRWMVQEIVNTNSGIKFLDDKELLPLLQRWNIPLKEAGRPQPEPSLPPLSSPLSPPPKVLEQPRLPCDADATIIDELKPKFEGFFLWIFWCFLEVLPTYYEWQVEKRGEWVWYWQYRQVTHPCLAPLQSC